MREMLVIACLLAGTVAGDRALDLASRPREGRIGGVGGDSRYSAPLGPYGQQNRRVLELGTAEDPGNYVYIDDYEEYDSIDTPGLEFTYGDAVEGYVPDSYSAAPSYADPSLLSQVMHQAEQANFRFPVVTTKPPRIDMDTAASSLGRPETNEINPFSLFPPQFHQLLNIPLHVYKNGSTFNPHSSHKNSPRVPVIHQGYANVHGGSSYRPSNQDTPVVAYRPKPVYAPKRTKTKPTMFTTTTSTTTERPRKPTYVHVHRTTTTRTTALTTMEKTMTTPKPTTTEKPRPITKPETKPTKISRPPSLRYTRRPASQTTTPKPFTPFNFPTSRPVSLAPTRNNVPDIPNRPRPETRPVLIPETRLPVTVKTQRPLVTETSQPEILYYDAPETNPPFIPETRRPVVPETNRPFAPETRRPVVPETRRPFNPDTRRPVILETKIPSTPKPQNEDTKEESKPKPFSPSKLDPFSINPPPTPLPAPIRPAFENGPESLPPVVNTFNVASEPKIQSPIQIRPIAPAHALLPVADALITYAPAPLNPPPSPLNLPTSPLIPPPFPLNPTFNLSPSRPQPPQGPEDFLVRPLHINAIRPPPPLPQRPIFAPAPIRNPTPPPPRPEQQPPRLSNNNPWASRPVRPDVRPPPFRVIPPANPSQVQNQNRPIVKSSDSTYSLPNEAENLPPVRNINNNTPQRLQRPTGPNVLPQFRPNAPPQRENFRITETPSRRRHYRVRPIMNKRPSFLERLNFFGGSEPVNRRKGVSGGLIDTNSATNKLSKKPEVVVPQYKLPSDALQGNAQKVVVLGPYDRPPPGAPLIQMPDSSLAPPPSLIPAAPSPPTPPHLIRSNQKPSMNKKEFRTPTVQKKPHAPAYTDVAPPPFQPQPLVQIDSKKSSISSENLKNIKKPSSAVVYGSLINPETYIINSNKAETKVSSNFKVINMKNKEQHVVTAPSPISDSITRPHKPQVTGGEVSEADKAAIVAGRINFPPSVERSDQFTIPFPVPSFKPPFRVKHKRFRPARPVAVHRQGQAAQRRVINVDAPTQQQKLKSPPKQLLRRPINGGRPGTNGPAVFMRPPPPPPKNPLHPKPFSLRVPPQSSLNAKHPIPPPPPRNPPPPPPVRPASQSTSSGQSTVVPVSKKPVYSKINTSIQDSPRPVYVRRTTMKPITTTKKQPEPISILTSAQTVPSVITERSTPMRVTEYTPYGPQNSQPHTPGSFKEPIIPEASYGGWKVVGAPSVPKEGESLSPVVGYVKENTPEIIIKSDLVEDVHSDIVTGINRVGVAAPDNSDLVQYSSRLTIQAPGVIRSYWVNPPQLIN